jgi:CubicO group peptidase (beta-lactamase class C family)
MRFFTFHYFTIITLLFCLASCNTKGQKSEGGRFTEFSPIKRELSRIQQEKANRLEKIFDELNKNGQFNGNVLIEQNDTIIFSKCYGYADKERKIKLNDSSAFQLASVSKTITAAAVLVLADWEIINLNDPVNKYVSEFPYPKVIIRDLLTHRSGLPNYLHLCSPMIKHHPNNFDNNEILCFLDSVKPKVYCQPDRRFEYSNTNYFILATLVERTTGLSFNEFVKTKIFKPLGMNNTFFFTDKVKNEYRHMTKGYTMDWRPVLSDPFDGVLGDKGVYSTTTDMLLFAKAYFGGKLFNQKLLQEATSPHSKEEHEGNYGYGWRMKNFQEGNPEKLIYHNGWWHGYRNAFQHRLKDNTHLIILSNRLNKSVYESKLYFDALDNVSDSAVVNQTLSELKGVE